ALVNPLRLLGRLLFTTALCLAGWSCRSDRGAAFRSVEDTLEQVGPAGNNRFVTPANQILTPVGRQVELPGMRPQALALSPGGRILVTSGKTAELVVVSPTSGRILQRVALPSDKDTDPQPEPVSGNILAPDKEGQVSFTGLIFSADGSRLYLANV